jgi:hypothetical protein
MNEKQNNFPYKDDKTTKLLPGTDTEGVHFNKERMQQRLVVLSSL